jgi:hypothetical protein
VGRVRIQHVVQSVLSTVGVVLLIVREATDKNYQIAEFTYGCSDGAKEVYLPQLPQRSVRSW